MKTLKRIFISTILSFIYYVAFVKDIVLFEFLSWFLVSMAFIGILIPSSKQDFLKIKWYDFLIGFPFLIFNLWMFFKNGGETFGYTYLLFTLSAYCYFFIIKTESKNNMKNRLRGVNDLKEEENKN
jgi:hypothetical protein